FFGKRTKPETDRDKLLALVKKLGDKSADTRNQATAELVSYGPAAVPALRQGANDLDDTEAAAGARKCLQALDGSAGPTLSAAAARPRPRPRPAGAAQALLDFLPLAEDGGVSDEVGRSLQTVAVRDGKLAPAISKALKDSVPARRALAAEVLSKTGGAEE